MSIRSAKDGGKAVGLGSAIHAKEYQIEATGRWSILIMMSACTKAWNV